MNDFRCYVSYVSIELLSKTFLVLRFRNKLEINK